MCSFFDKNIEIKKLEVNAAEQKIKIQEHQRIPKLSLSSSWSSRDYHSGKQKNNFALGLGLTSKLYGGGLLEKQISDAIFEKTLLKTELQQLEDSRRLSVSNFQTLESALISSIVESQDRLTKLGSEIQEIEDRKVMGLSVFEELISKQIQAVELEIILADLEGRLLNTWLSHLEKLIAY